jgi:tetratricopeptide (TPR) repeat protein/CHAT domain-containing protein
LAPFLGLIAVMLGVWSLTVGGVSGAPPDELTPEQRQALERKAAELNEQAIALQRRGQYSDAIKRVEQILPLCRQLYPPDQYPQGHPDLANSLKNLGFLLSAQREYQKALPYYQQALAMCQALYPPDQYPQGHPDLADSFRTLGGLHSAREEYTEALPYYRQALAMIQALYPPDKYPQGHPDVARASSDLGFLLAEQGEPAKALPYYEQALAMYRRLYPPDKYPHGHARLAASLNNLGGVLSDQGAYARALPYYEQALAMRRALYPPDQYPQGHPDVALSLDNLAYLLRAQGEYTKAVPYHQQALAVYRHLYPADKYPQGHPRLATSLSNLGATLSGQGEYAQALPYYEQALAMRQALFPSDKYPRGHSDVANSLNNLGFLLCAQGEYAKALPYYEQALAMRRALFPSDKYPQGHPSLATSLNNLGALLSDQGEQAQALPYYEQALAMRQALFPPDRYPQGHPDVAQSLSNVGSWFADQQEHAKALPYHEQALAMYRRLYPPEKIPQGHPHLAVSLNNLGFLLSAQGEYTKALAYHEQALAMYRRLYPPQQHPQGHPHHAASLSNVGFMLSNQGEYAQALPYHKQALAMRRQLYPPDLYPQGHPDLAESLNNVGFVLAARGEYAQALPYSQQAQAMYQQLVSSFLTGASEAETYNFAASLPQARDGLLSLYAHLAPADETFYLPVWQGKAAITRLLERRQQALLETADAETQQLWRQLLATRRELAHLALAATSDRAGPPRRAQELSRGKQELERQLVARLPDLRRHEELARRSPADLARKLPPRTLFIDLLAYTRWEHDANVKGKAGERRTRCYLAFVLDRDHPVRRVELGAAEPINAAVDAWRRDLSAGKTGTRAEALRRLVWEPLAKHVPAGTETVLLAPDGALTQLPWCALPGRRPGTVLLEDHALAVVPHGPFLLERLTAATEPEHAAGLMLAVGGVSYDEEPGPAAGSTKGRPPLRSAEQGSQKLAWSDLPGTLRELERLLDLLDKGNERRRLVRRGTEASTGQLLLDLPQARWAHLATHGFFADARFRSGLQLSADMDRRGRRGERIGVGARNPLVLSGLVLAGANRPVVKDKNGVPQGDGGLLTAEAIAGLPLHKLELAVLSACETGLGEVAGGEGVFGLQRAFHLAGARNVIASLWKVDDQATAALMALFYHHLWREGKPPLAALRAAQLTLYRHPERIGQLAGARGVDFDKLARLPAEPAKESRKTERAPVKLWAGFVLSGPGR